MLIRNRQPDDFQPEEKPVVRPAPDSKTERTQELEAALAERILVLDGAMGTPSRAAT